MQKGQIKLRSKVQLLCAGALIASCSGAAWAQNAIQSTSNETAVTSVGGEDVIIVTARNYVPEGSLTASKSDIPLIRTPQSVSVVTRDQIDLLNFIDAQQAVRYVSGVTGENYGPDLRYDFISVRGFTPRQFIDGLAAPVSTSIQSVGVDLYAFESFEVLKGPASVLYGSAPPGGIYNQVSRRASEDFGGEIQAKYGMYDYKSVSGTVTGAVTDDLAVRFTGLGLDRNAERRGVDSQRILASPTFTWKLGDRTEITGLGYYQYDEVNGDTNGFLPAVGTLLPNPLGQIDHRANFGEPDFNKFVRRQWAVGWDASHELAEGISLQSNAKFSRYHEESRVIYGGGGLGADNRTLGRFSFPYDEKVKSLAIDNRLAAKVDTGAISHNFLAGVDYRNVTNVSAFGFAVATPIDIFNPVYSTAPIVNPALSVPFSNIKLKQTGVYVQDQFGFGNLYILAGGRYDWVKIDDRNGGTETKQHKFTWRVGANYVFDNGFAPYIGYAKSFEPVIGTDSTTLAPFKPSSGRQVEGGIKYNVTAGDVKIFATAALFDIKQTNVVTTGTSIVPVFGTQTGAVKSSGGELELVARIREQLSINASYSYNDTEVTKDANPAAIGARLVTTPKHKASLFVDYTLQRGALGGLGFGAGARYSSSSAGSLPDAFNPTVLYGDASTTFDAIVHYDTPGWRLAVNASNLFDKRFVARCASLSNCTYGAGRQVIGTVTKKF
ncbi:TonB-dependent siderophore receptor [Sphingomonas sp. SRS2]|uniref:TonB-dependent siderophore receptor n=1 Tax=Sphingomonas sp. SRS2 TaxID=133190 RepID=UPI0006184888|nr:TonB-dependent siderophore receptor [Sphingomonas sp. SRS2]KKC25557.1 membrane protein [Sphingomonas sp. SRS2]